MSPAAEIIFHQYAMSPFSEKIRKIFALKNIAYRNVEQPMWMPKPHLTPMTGGYRRIPVMQIGADVYCDTALIARKLERMAPKPSLYPDNNATAVEAVAAWADRQLFLVCVPIVFGALAEVLPKELIEDRKRMRPDLDIAVLRAGAPSLRAALAIWCARLDRALESRKHLLSAGFSLADAAVYHCLWFVRNDPASAAALARYPRLGDWLARLDAMGAGKPQDMGAEEALQIAGTSEPVLEGTVAEDDPSGLKRGMNVGVFSDDLPSDVFTGQLVAAADDEMVILREDAKLGRIALHFPRIGYFVRPA
jgi:glutathione S-transferase